MLSKLFNLLSNTDFQDPNSGLLTFPAYVYIYPAEREYQLRKDVKGLLDRLDRPKVFQDCLHLNFYHIFIEYLQKKKFGKWRLFDKLTELEEKNPQKAEDQIDRYIRSQDFILYINQKIQKHLNSENTNGKSYVLMNGFGSIFPYIRVHKFLNLMEKHVRNYKLIVLYPGTYEDNYYRMFNLLEGKSIYRGSCLNPD